MNRYQNPKTAQKYLDYLESPDGQTQREILSAAIFEQLQNSRSLRVLDAACGTGWLTVELAKRFDQVQGFDSSEFLLRQAKQKNPELNLAKADILSELPYPDNYFDIVILNMVTTDVDDLDTLYANLARILKPEGRLITTTPNPSYAFPVGVWKRGFLGWIFRRKPTLKVRPWSKFKSGGGLSWHDTFSHYFYPLSTHIQKAKLGGFALAQFSELQSKTDSSEFNLRYQLYRYPLFTLLTFVKR
jgi:ubiquinone/menaquinone biosynthesis C-methylase UbiE